MPGEQLHITLIQPDIVWENKEANLQQYEKMIAGISGVKHVVALPEMFSTGFSMAPERLAEMLWVQPDGKIGTYDKRHLFAYADEEKHYTCGDKRLIVSVNGWRINLMVCYDLRFPVWARNQGDEYDVLLYVANWPEPRSLAWRTLLQARAIENQSYVVGVNRVGKDGKDFNYLGESSVFGPLGEQIWQKAGDPACHTVSLEKEVLQKVRTKLPFLNDADKFLLL